MAVHRYYVCIHNVSDCNCNNFILFCVFVCSAALSIHSENMEVNVVGWAAVENISRDAGCR